MKHDERFGPPIWSAYRVAAIHWRDGVTYTVGDAIAFDVRLYGRDARDVRRDGVIVELWIDPWWGGTLAYAEVLTTEGVPERAWLHRDHLGPVGTLGAIPEGALL